MIFDEAFEKLITPGNYDPQYPVDAFWDIGADDHTAIIIVQVRPEGSRILSYVETPKSEKTI